MFSFHSDRALYFQHQTITTQRYILPFIVSGKPLPVGTRVLEVGTGEGGVLKAFMDNGCHGIGIDIDPNKLSLASQLLATELHDGRCKLLVKNIFEIDLERDLAGAVDLIILKDVIEHIEDQAKCLKVLKGFLKSDGLLFIGFPPWQMPFGGHQQVCRSPFLSRLPYVHLLPTFLFVRLLLAFGESTVSLLAIRSTRLSIETFERFANHAGFTIKRRHLYAINPIYALKFRLKPRLQHPWISRIPVLRNFVTTCAYYVLKPTSN